MAVFNKTEEKKHQYAEPWDDSDVILKVEDEKFHVHSMILGFASPVFKAMLSSNFKEGKEKVINLPGKNKRDIVTLLNIIYPTDFMITGDSNCTGLLELGREYDIRRISLLVDEFLCHDVKCS
ncbi:BTB and MATH domain-containing protein 38-like [Hydractinia symbiolongicarpus]|uniref:BTB and MATH domain-containing protein 38-like n=1 Tax=Hydractinia symbiolongicarpus TaxID=13093 RepID=UPI00254E56D6|nr:BTB and MATH domain-containing protein 38-like [Hydractinia symbiolongicarpus]